MSLDPAVVTREWKYYKRKIRKLEKLHRGGHISAQTAGNAGGRFFQQFCAGARGGDQGPVFYLTYGYFNDSTCAYVNTVTINNVWLLS